jgi:hypothetical protein
MADTTTNTADLTAILLENRVLAGINPPKRTEGVIFRVDYLWKPYKARHGSGKKTTLVHPIVGTALSHPELLTGERLIF